MDNLKQILLLPTVLSVVLLAGCGGSDGGDAAPSAAETAMDKATEAGEKAADAAADMADDAAEAAGDAMDNAAEAVDEATDAMGDMAEDAKDAMGDIADDAKDAMGDMADDAEDAAGEAMDKAEDAVEEAAAAVSGSAAPASTGPCDLVVEVGDSIAFNVTEMSVPSSCSDINLTIAHTGALPAVAMGHNWVLVAESDMDAIVADGAAQGADNNWVDSSDDRVIAATKLVGGGESDTITFSASALDAGTSYAYVCTVPGHSFMMKGSFTIS